MGVLGGISRLSLGLGRGKVLLRRVGGLALLCMGVHVAMDLLDDHIFALLDRIDLLIDSAYFSMGAWLEEVGILRSGRGAAFAEDAGEWIGLGEKETLALSLALALEILGDLLLAPLAWGDRRPHSGPPPAGPLTLRGLTIPQVLAFFAAGLLPLAGGLGVARGLELGLARGLGGLAPSLPGILPLSAAFGLATALVIVWRFVPDLLRGAVAQLRQGAFVDGGRRPWLRLIGRLILLLPLMAGALLALPGWWALLSRLLGGLS